MNILITGGAGFIGSHTAQHFIEQNHRVFVLDNLSTGLRENIDFIRNDRFFKIDIRDYEQVEYMIKKYQFDIIVHLAAVVSVVDTVKYPLLSNEVNLDATIKLLDMNRKDNSNIKRMVFASSAAVYGNDPELPKSLNSSINPASPYAIQKFAGEQCFKIYNKLYQLPTTSLRFFNVYGPKQNPDSPYSGVLSIMKRKFDEDQTFSFYGDGLQTRDFVFVKDVVNAISLVCSQKQAIGNIYNVGSGHSYSLQAVFDIYKDIYRKDLKVEYKEERAGDIKHSVADITDIRALGYEPQYTIDQGLLAYLTLNVEKYIS